MYEQFVLFEQNKCHLDKCRFELKLISCFGFAHINPWARPVAGERGRVVWEKMLKRPKVDFPASLNGFCNINIKIFSCNNRVLPCRENKLEPVEQPSNANKICLQNL